MNKKQILLFLFLSLLIVCICFLGYSCLFLKKPKPAVKLTKRLPIAGLDNKAQLNLAIERQLQILSKKTFPESLRRFKDTIVSQEFIIKSLKRFQELLNTYEAEGLRQALLYEFDIYKSTGDTKGNVLFTGYYTPLFKALKKPTEEFQYPLYKLPDNYQLLDISPLREKWKNTSITVYVDDTGNIRLPPSRREIEEQQLYSGKNLEIAWLKDPFDTFIAQVQGSLIVEYKDGQRQFLNYAGKNGYEYTSIGRELFLDEKIELDKLNLSTMRKWFKEHPDSLDEYLNRNDSYVFFEPEEDGPYGVGDVIVTEWASIATDKRLFPVGGVALIDTQIPILDINNNLTGWRKHTCFVIDQDTGGAIVGPGRVDIYMGIGEKAGGLAGYQKQEGRLYYLLLQEH